MSADNTNNIDKEEQLKLDALNAIFRWIEDETRTVMINKYYNNKEHRESLKAFLDDMVKALDESTAETKSKKEIKKHLSYIR